MAISTSIATPSTLVKDQKLSLKEEYPELECYNDSAMSERHYRTIPNENNNEGNIQWANVPSVLLQDKDYAISVAMFEYVYTGDIFRSNIAAAHLNAAYALTGNKFTDDEGRGYYIQKGSVKVEGDRVTFRKIVWVLNSKLVLGTAAQQDALTEAQKKKAQDEIDALLKEKPEVPKTGNSANSAISSTVLWIGGLILVFILGVIFLFKGLSKRKKEQDAKDKNESQSPVNIIRIPKK